MDFINIRSLIDILSIVKQKVYCNVNNVVYSITDPVQINLVTPKIETHHIKIRDIDKLWKYAQITDELKKEYTKFKYLIEHGVIIYLARYKSNIMGYYLVTDLDIFRPYLYNNHPLFESPKRRYYIFHCHTFERYRGNSVYPYMLTVISRDIFNINKNSVIYVSTSVNNIPSQRGIKKAGFKKLGNLKYYQIGPIVLKSDLLWEGK
jgi:RimJ/RimL family protein N-acetyltransferase